MGKIVVGFYAFLLVLYLWQLGLVLLLVKGLGMYLWQMVLVLLLVMGLGMYLW
jgi:hypothetical protein